MTGDMNYYTYLLSPHFTARMYTSEGVIRKNVIVHVTSTFTVLHFCLMNSTLCHDFSFSPLSHKYVLAVPACIYTQHPNNDISFKYVYYSDNAICTYS